MGVGGWVDGNWNRRMRPGVRSGIKPENGVLPDDGDEREREVEGLRVKVETPADHSINTCDQSFCLHFIISKEMKM